MSRNVSEETEKMHDKMRENLKKVIRKKYNKQIKELYVYMDGGDDYYYPNTQWDITVITKPGIREATREKIRSFIHNQFRKNEFHMPYGGSVKMFNAKK